MRNRFAACLLTLSLCARAYPAMFFPGELGPVKKLFDAGRYQEVIRQLSPEEMQRLSGENLARAYLYLGQSYARTGALDKALGVLQLGTKIFPKDINLLTELGVLLHRSGLEEQAGPLFQKVLQIHPNNAQAHLGLAEIGANLGFLDRSATHYEKALETLGANGDVWRDYAEVLYRQRDYKTAELAAQKSLELSPRADGWIDLAFIQRGEGRLDEALGALSKAQAAAPERSQLSLLRQTWLLEAGRTEEALVLAERTLEKDPNNPVALWTRAQADLSRGETAAASRDLQRIAAGQTDSPFCARAAAALLELERSRP